MLFFAPSSTTLTTIQINGMKRLPKRNNRSATVCLSFLIVASVLVFDSNAAFFSAPLFFPTERGRLHKSSSPVARRSWKRWKLYYNDDEQQTPADQVPSNFNNPAQAKGSNSSSLERLDLAGVTISAQPPGFFVLFKAQQGTLPLAVTLDPQDTYATTSPESLTLVQLLSNVDMAGPILPPETLAKLVVLSCESVPDFVLEEPQRQVLAAVRTSLEKVKAAWASSSSSPSWTKTSNDGGGAKDPTIENTDNVPGSSLSYADAHPWLQSRVQLPQVTLDELVLSYVGDYGVADDDETLDNLRASLSSPSSWECTLQCKIKSIAGTIFVRATPDLIRAVTYNYDDRGSSNLFTCIALALRYKAPIVLQNQASHPTTTTTTIDTTQESSANTRGGRIPFVTDEATLNALFPQHTTVGKLQQTGTRVTQNIEKGFEIHKLTKALEMARRLGDAQAETKIRAALDHMDSFQELPITTPAAEERGGEVLPPPVDEGVSLSEADDPTSFQ